MAAPKNATYVPKSGPLAGQVFTGMPGTSQAYNQYQQARARALGFSGYREERQIREVSRGIFTGERNADRFASPGRLPGSARTEITGILGKYKEDIKNGFRLPNGRVDRRIGGRLDMYLRDLGRRDGTETFPPGESPKMQTELRIA